MRTRRIAIRCRRTGRSAAIAIGTTGSGAPGDLPVPEMPPGLAVPPMPALDLPPLYGAPADHTAPAADHAAPQRPGLPVPAYLSDPAHPPAEAAAHVTAEASARAPAEGARGPVNPWRSNRGPDLTLADVLAGPGRRNLDWNRNPGWPAGIGWSQIARAARGRSPRHARTDGWWLPNPALVWTGIGFFAAAVLILVADLFL
jgi:hypothetical protein